VRDRGWVGFGWFERQLELSTPTPRRNPDFVSRFAGEKHSFCVTSPVTSDSKTLVAEAAFVRRLAGALLRDASLADDVSQEVLAMALQQPQPPRNWRHWLTTVTRRLALKVGKTNKLRARHEANAAPTESGDPERGALDRLEMYRQLTDAVLGLAEPYRTAVTLRFLEGLTPRAIAHRTDTSSELVRQRVRRGLAMLRARLDDQHGSRGAWCAALASLGFAVAPVPLLGLSMLAMNKLTIAAGVSLVGTIAALSYNSFATPSITPNQARPTANSPAAQATKQVDDLPAERTPFVANQAKPCSVNVRNASGEAIANATVICWQDDGGFIEARTDAAGDAQFASSGSGGLLALCNQLLPACSKLPECSGHHHLVLQRGASVSGVLLIDGQPAPKNVTLVPHIGGAYVLPDVPDGLQARLIWSGPDRFATHANGTFVLTGLPNDWRGSIQLPRHIWLLPASGGTSDQRYSFGLERGRTDYLIQTTQLPTMTGEVLWDDNNEPVTQPNVNVSAEFDDGEHSGHVGPTLNGNQFLVGIWHSGPNHYLQWIEPTRRPAITRFRIYASANGSDGTTELVLDREQFLLGSVVVRIKRARISHFLAVASDGVPLDGALVNSRNGLSEPTGPDGRGNFAGDLDQVKEVGALGCRIGPTTPRSGSGSADDPWIFELKPDNPVTVHLLDRDGHLPTSLRLRLTGTGLMLAGTRRFGKLDQAIHSLTISNQVSGGRTNEPASHHRAVIPLPDHGTTVELHSLEPGRETRISLVDVFGNEAAAQSFQAPDFGEALSVTLRVDQDPKSLLGQVLDNQMRSLAKVGVVVQQLTPEGEPLTWPGGRGAVGYAQADAEGKFALHPVYSDADYSVLIKAKGYAPLKQIVRHHQLNQEVSLVMQPGQGVHVTVTSTTGTKLPLHVNSNVRDVAQQRLLDGTTQFDNLPAGEVTFTVTIGNSKFSIVHPTSRPKATIKVPQPAQLAVAMAGTAWPQLASGKYFMAKVTRLDQREEPLSMWRPDREGAPPMDLLPGRYRVELVENGRLAVGPLGLTAEVILRAGKLTTARLQ
jgi:RNA polymerase sigma factor (sigma-70 family)